MGYDCIILTNPTRTPVATDCASSRAISACTSPRSGRPQVASGPALDLGPRILAPAVARSEDAPASVPRLRQRGGGGQHQHGWEA
eukprot:scaffold2900_cov330-Prasinococcus_capsulatus_cf.AAC.1